MKRIYDITGTQIIEKASLIVNNTNFRQQDELYFVQLDDEHSVDNTGAIFQIIDKKYAKEVAENANNVLQYEGKSGIIYNYAEDTVDFEEDSEDLDIYSHCYQKAEFFADEIDL